MRNIITVVLLTISLASFGQKKDSTAKDSLTSDTKFLSVNDLLNFSEPLKDKVTAKQFEIYMALLNEVIKAAVAEYYKKKELPKK